MRRYGFSIGGKGQVEEARSKVTAETNKTTVSSYSRRGSREYEDPLNKNFLYGELTKRFIHQIEFQAHEQRVLDIGCGTGFIFDELNDEFEAADRQGIGIDPADGMLEIARDKYQGVSRYEFKPGSFEDIPVEDNTVDKIVSTLALHWVKSLEPAAQEMRRVIKDTGSMDILMIARDDGAEFKKAIVEALKKHLSFRQIMKTATLVQRVTAESFTAKIAPIFEGFELNVVEHRDIIYGSFDDHMKWWKARSSPVIAEVEDKETFMTDLQTELEKTSTEAGIPFDTAYLCISARG